MVISEKIPLDKLDKLYVDEVVRFHAIPLKIVSDYDPRFTSNFGRTKRRIGDDNSYKYNLSSTNLGIK